VLGAGLAQLYAHIDETGCETQPVGGNDLGISGGDRTAKGGYSRAFDQQVARRIAAAGRIDQSGTADQDRVHRPILAPCRF
jgi:hypothetical protein